MYFFTCKWFIYVQTVAVYDVNKVSWSIYDFSLLITSP